MSFLNSLSFTQLLWLVPIFFTLHNLEEAPFMENWSKRLPFKIHPKITTRQFAIAITFLTLAGFLVTYIAMEYLQNTVGYVLVLGIQAVLLFNAFIPHIASTIGFRIYSPGVVTAVLLTLPFSWYLYQRAFSEHILSWSQFWMLLAIAPFATVLFALASLQLGKIFAR
jgi:hypothetical protein